LERSLELAVVAPQGEIHGTAGEGHRGLDVLDLRPRHALDGGAADVGSEERPRQTTERPRDARGVGAAAGEQATDPQRFAGRADDFDVVHAAAPAVVDVEDLIVEQAGNAC
jgi:hypothetical protein